MWKNPLEDDHDNIYMKNYFLIAFKYLTMTLDYLNIGVFVLGIVLLVCASINISYTNATSTTTTTAAKNSAVLVLLIALTLMAGSGYAVFRKYYSR